MKILVVSIKYQDQIVATLLKLELDNKIKILDNDIQILNEENLAYSEKMLIKTLRGVKSYSNKYIAKELMEDNIQDCQNSDLFYYKYSMIEKVINGFYSIGVILWLINFFLFAVGGMSKILTGESLIIMFICHFTILFTLLLFGKCIKLPLIKNEKGIELQQKLIGLKNFLKDYSNISNVTYSNYNFNYRNY